MRKEAETVKEIFRLYTEEGQSISYIAKKLNDENIQREQRGNVKISGFTDRTVRIILSNPVYAGMISRSPPYGKG
ncbi:MAG: recombinase family protein [Lachnospira sp.]